MQHTKVVLGNVSNIIGWLLSWYRVMTRNVYGRVAYIPRTNRRMDNIKSQLMVVPHVTAELP